MNPSTLELTDIFKSAFFLSQGSDLTEIRIRNHGKRMAIFLITGDNLARLDRDYRAGRALVNPLQLRASLNQLRDIMFEKLRQTKGRTRNGDRQRHNRIHQKKH